MLVQLGKSLVDILAKLLVAHGAASTFSPDVIDILTIQAPINIRLQERYLETKVNRRLLIMKFVLVLVSGNQLRQLPD